jgi:hypothetical protein
MVLNLYRRHGSHCVGGRALHDMSYETDELRRSWEKCYCPIYVSGTLERPLRANIDETVLLVLITEQGENGNQCEEQRNSFDFSHGFACR